MFPNRCLQAKEKDLLIPVMRSEVGDEYTGATVIEPNRGYVLSVLVLGTAIRLLLLRGKRTNTSQHALLDCFKNIEPSMLLQQLSCLTHVRMIRL